MWFTLQGASEAPEELVKHADSRDTPSKLPDQYDDVHSNCFHRSYKVEEPKYQFMDEGKKQNVVYTHNELFFNLKNEGNSDTCYYTDES